MVINEFYLHVVGHDKTVCCWDIRQPHAPLQKLERCEDIRINYSLYSVYSLYNVHVKLMYLHAHISYHMYMYQ